MAGRGTRPACGAAPGYPRVSAGQRWLSGGLEIVWGTKIRTESMRALIVLGRLGSPPESVQAVGEVVVRDRIVGIDLQGGSKVGDRIVQMSVLQQEAGQTDVGRRVVGTDLEGRPVLRQRLRTSLHPGESIAEVVVRLGELRLQGDRRPELSRGLFQPARIEPCAAQVVPRHRVVWIGLHRPFETGGGLI